MEPKNNKEASIFAAACAAIREKGFHQARIMDIARKAGISYGLVYHYFRSKDELFGAINREWWSGIWKMMDECESSELSIEGKFGIIAEYFLDLYDENPDLIHIFVTEISRAGSNLTQESIDCFRRFFDRVEALIAKAQGEGRIRTDVRPRYLTYIFLGSLEGFLSAMALENRPVEGPRRKKRIAEGVLQVFFHGALTQSSRAG
jgi:AcrR family transcriptional regulator